LISVTTIAYSFAKWQQIVKKQQVLREKRTIFGKRLTFFGGFDRMMKENPKGKEKSNEGF